MTGLANGPSFGQEEMNLQTRLLRVFHDPGRSFSAIVGRESANDWLLPVLLASLVGVGAYFLTVDLVVDLESPAAREQMAEMSEAEREQYVQGIQTYGWMQMPVMMFFSLAVVSGVLLMFTRYLFDKEVSYRQMLVVKGYASMVLIPEWIVRTPLILIQETADVYTGPGVFVPAEMANSFFGKMLIGINLFDLWQIWIMGIGIAVMSRAPVKKATLLLLILWGLWIMGGAAVESMASGMPPAGPAPVE
ncbi:MAG: hypothetical protein HOC74_19430 [Gemmatimonadetes bacterium]|jgi:hypothetical protein|nr:hypothetical protein [Gemmatimonadota bacterium]